MKTSEALARFRGGKVSKKPKDRLSAVAVLINAEHKAVGESIKSGVLHAVKAGELLIKAKGMMAHGEWLPWLEKHCDFSRETAARYIRAFEQLPNVAPGPHFNYREALRLLSVPDENVHFSSQSPQWSTPGEIIERAVNTFGEIGLDPCSDGRTVPALTHFTAEDDGLARAWFGTVYMNPPYGSEIGTWVHKLCEQYGLGNVTEAIALVPARTDTEWFSMFRDFAICFVRGRLKFSGHENSAPFPSAVVYLGKNRAGFCRAFEEIGDVWVRVQE